eukprot:SAG31_NODE_6447_length_2015_cov_1.102818_3_plen_173_part_01
MDTRCAFLTRGLRKLHEDGTGKREDIDVVLLLGPCAASSSAQQRIPLGTHGWTQETAATGGGRSFQSTQVISLELVELTPAEDTHAASWSQKLAAAKHSRIGHALHATAEHQHITLRLSKKATVAEAAESKAAEAETTAHDCICCLKAVRPTVPVNCDNCKCSGSAKVYNSRG